MLLRIKGRVDDLPLLRENWMDIAGGLGMSRALGVLAVIPPLHFVILGVLAFASREYSGQLASE